MPRYFIEVYYKGTNYSGFQVQQNAATIQSEVEKALNIYYKKPMMLTGASRTDAGVHALQNYFHFDASEDLFSTNNLINAETKLRQAIYSCNSILPSDIVIKKIFKVESEAHCRFDAISREYKYFIYSEKNPFYKETAFFYPYKIMFQKLQEAAQIILNTKDFTSFSKRNTQVNNFNCEVFKSEWIKDNERLVYKVVANRFLRGMVRGLVGTMLSVGTGKLSISEFKNVVENRNVAKADFAVPAHGLFLIQIKY